VSVEVKNYVGEGVVEEVYASSNTIPASTTSPLKVQNGRVRDGYDAVAVSVACTQDADVTFFLKVKGKQVYDNGLNTAGLAGLQQETFLFHPIYEGQDWEVGFTNVNSSTAKTVSWRFRLRLFKR